MRLGVSYHGIRWDYLLTHLFPVAFEAWFYIALSHSVSCLAARQRLGHTFL